MADGKIVRDKDGVTRLVPHDEVDETSASDFVDLERGGDVALDAHGELPRRGIDSGLSQVEELVWRQANAAEGDENQLSVSLAEDVWHLLTVDLSISRLLALEAALELANIVFFAALMFAVDLLEGSSWNETSRPRRCSSRSSCSASPPCV